MNPSRQAPVPTHETLSSMAARTIAQLVVVERDVARLRREVEMGKAKEATMARSAAAELSLHGLGNVHEPQHEHAHEPQREHAHEPQREHAHEPQHGRLPPRNRTATADLTPTPGPAPFNTPPTPTHSLPPALALALLKRDLADAVQQLETLQERQAFWKEEKEKMMRCARELRRTAEVLEEL